jgi:DNA polymerase-3 subunit alpha
MRGVAMTDNANMFGALQLYKACKERDLWPIIGCEVNVARMQEARERKRTPVDHLVLLARNEEGYKNLIRLVSKGQIEQASDTAASLAWETVAAETRGLVGLTGCMGGIVAQQVLEQGEAAGLAMLERMKSAFEPGSLFVELQDHDLVEQPVLNKILIECARKLELPIVATNDVHYLAREDADAQLYLSCAQSGRTYAEAKAGHHGSAEMYFKSADEMARRFRELPEALRATLTIAEMCGGLKIELGRPMLPDFKVPDGFDTASYFAHVAREGLRHRFQEFAVLEKTFDKTVYEQRLEVEIDVIVDGLRGLLPHRGDFIRHAKNRGVPVRAGLGAGSLVAYSMRITDLDPIPFGLFRAFLEPGTRLMPD